MPQAISTRRQKAASPPPAPLEVTTKTERTIRQASPEALEEAQHTATEPARPVDEVKERLSGYGPWEKLQAMTPADWQHSIGTLYRHKGQQTEETAKQPRGAGYLDKFAQPITLDFVKQNYGGGYYWWIVNYDNDVLCSLNFRIDAPPKADGAVLQQGSEGKTVELLTAMLERAQADAKSNLVDPQQAVTKIMDVVSDANKSLWTMFQTQIPKQTDPMQQMQLMLSMLKEVKALSSPTPDPVVPNPAQNGEAQLEKSIALLDRLGLLKKSNDDGLSGLGKVIGTLKEWGVIPPAVAGGGGANDWKSVLADNAPAILGHVESIVTRVTTAIIQGRPQGPVQVAAQAVGNVRPGARTVIAARSSPAAGTNGRPPETDQAPAGGPPGVVQMNEEELITMAQANVDAFIWIRLSQLVRGGTTGDEVANMLENLAPEMATELRTKTPAEIETLIGQVPIPDVAGLTQHPRLKPFIQEFLDYWKPEATAEAGGQ